MGNAILVEPYDLGTVTAEGSAAGTTPGNLNNDWIGVVHRGTSTTTASINADLGSARSVDTVALLSCAPTNGSLLVLGGTSGLSGDVYNSGFVSFIAGATPPVSGRLNSLHLLPTPQTARHWSTTIAPLSGNVFEAGRMVVGRRIQFARNFSFGGAFGARDLGSADFSRQGVWLPSGGARLRTLGLSFSRVTKQEAEEQLHDLLQRIGNTEMMLVVTDPDANALRQRRMFFGPLIGNLETLWQVADGWEWRANLVSVI